MLVSLDTLRADRVGSYGWARKGTPVLDRLASEGTRLDTVVAQAPWTLPSHATMLTGFYPCVHGLTSSLGHPLPPGVVPLAERLRAAGYATAATPEDIFFDPAAFARGFGFYHENHSNDPIRMPVTVGFAVDWLRTQATTPFFLLVHTYQAHEPYFAPPAIRAAFGAPAQTVGTDAPREQQAAQYDAAVAYTDARWLRSSTRSTRSASATTPSSSSPAIMARRSRSTATPATGGRCTRRCCAYR